MLSARRLVPKDAPYGAHYEPTPFGAYYEKSPYGAYYEKSPYGAHYEPTPFGAHYEPTPFGAHYEPLFRPFPQNPDFARPSVRKRPAKDGVDFSAACKHHTPGETLMPEGGPGCRGVFRLGVFHRAWARNAEEQMAKFKDYYEALGLKRNTSAEDIKSSYRRLARKYHPDLNKTNPEAETRFREVQEAYDVLGDAVKRRQYDSLGTGYRAGMDFQMPPGWDYRTRTEKEAAADTGGGLGGFSDFFEMLFGGGMRAKAAASHRAKAANGASRAGERGGDVETVLTVTLDDIHQGATKKVQLHVNSTCAACQGGGMIGGERCRTCEGRGHAPRLRTMEIKIPLAARDGARLRLAGQGEGGTGPSAVAGDLYVKIKVQPHPIFTPEGKNIHIELPIAPWEAVLGGEVDVPTLDGLVKMKLPPGTQNGSKMRLQQRGLRTENSRGDEIVRIKVLIPTEVTERERHLFRQLRDISHFRPRVKERSTN